MDQLFSCCLRLLLRILFCDPMSVISSLSPTSFEKLGQRRIKQKGGQLGQLIKCGTPPPPTALLQLQAFASWRNKQPCHPFFLLSFNFFNFLPPEATKEVTEKVCIENLPPSGQLALALVFQPLFIKVT